ncbi:MAG TPA: hypothetical protein VHS78_12975 [Candidatus Elarobacter sp.]|jgi:hypothetical protein|nr:hypothetical protein [Candidatus Elarobacter sp.]
MKYLVFCQCGHSLDRHGADGCAGEGRMPCRCRNDQERALDSAVEHARRHPWGGAIADLGESEIA